MSLVSLVLTSFVGFLSWTQPAFATHFHETTMGTQVTKLVAVKADGLSLSDEPIDLNNASISAFAECPGFYPTLATPLSGNLWIA